MPYASNPNFLKRYGNYNVSKQMLDEEITLTRYFNATVDNLTSGAYYKIWEVPDGFCLTEARVICEAGQTNATIDIVDDDNSTTIFVNNGNLGASGAVTATNARKYYSSPGFIVMKPDTNLTTAKFWVMIKGIVLSKAM